MSDTCQIAQKTKMFFRKISRAGSKETPGSDVTSAESPLLKNKALPWKMRKNMITLLKLGHRPCDLKDASLPRNCFEAVAFVLGLDYVSQRKPERSNCREWNGPSMAPCETYLIDDPFDHRFINMIEDAGYKNVMRAMPFRTVHVIEEGIYHSNEIIGLNNLCSFEALEPGDVLVFGLNIRTEEDGSYSSFKHACIYLGKHKGKHYIFEKPSIRCGPDSPYRIISLTDKLSGAIGQPTDCENSCYDTVYVYRK